MKKAIDVKCSIKGCRKVALSGVSMCQFHYDANDAVEHTMKLTEIEALTFAKMDTEIRNCSQGIQLCDLRADKIRNEMNQGILAQSLEKQRLQNMLKDLQSKYVPYMRELAEKYEIADSAKMTIDPDTRVIRDLSDPKP
jgi:hypothetical protein